MGGTGYQPVLGGGGVGACRNSHVPGELVLLKIDADRAGNPKDQPGIAGRVAGPGVAGWLASILYPIVRYLKPLPQTGPTGRARLTREEISKLEQIHFVIVPVSGQRVIVLESATQELLAFSAICTHEGCTVTYQPGRSFI